MVQNLEEEEVKRLDICITLRFAHLVAGQLPFSLASKAEAERSRNCVSGATTPLCTDINDRLILYSSTQEGDASVDLMCGDLSGQSSQ